VTSCVVKGILRSLRFDVLGQLLTSFFGVFVFSLGDLGENGNSKTTKTSRKTKEFAFVLGAVMTFSYGRNEIMV
jgi:hypothetical protein